MEDRFRELRDDVEFALAGAIAHLSEIDEALDEIGDLVDDPAETQHVRERLAAAGSTIHEIAATFGRLMPDGLLASH